MERRQTTARGAKAERTRQHILDTALELFASKGYEGTTLQAIAQGAGYSTGLTYRYFSRKEDLVLALYRRLTHELEGQVRALPPATIAERFERTMRAHFAQLAPYREALAALFGAALDPASGVGILGAQAADIRASARAIFLQVVTGAGDAPRTRQARDLAQILFAAHLALILLWLQDPTPEAHATSDLLAYARDTFGRLRPLLWLPPVARSLAQLARLTEPLFGVSMLDAKGSGTPAAAEAQDDPDDPDDLDDPDGPDDPDDPTSTTPA